MSLLNLHILKSSFISLLHNKPAYNTYYKANKLSKISANNEFVNRETIEHPLLNLIIPKTSINCKIGKHLHNDVKESLLYFLKSFT